MHVPSQGVGIPSLTRVGVQGEFRRLRAVSRSSLGSPVPDFRGSFRSGPMPTPLNLERLSRFSKSGDIKPSEISAVF